MNLIGQTGYLTPSRVGIVTKHAIVISETRGKRNGILSVTMRCECGVEFTPPAVSNYKLPDSCGCKLVENVVGNRYGRLVVKKQWMERSGDAGVKWVECLCDCGEMKVARFSSVVTLATCSCGCKFSEHVAKLTKITPEVATELCEMLDTGLPQTWIAETIDISHHTITKFKKNPQKALKPDSVVYCGRGRWVPRKDV